MGHIKAMYGEKKSPNHFRVTGNSTTYHSCALDI